MKRQPRDTQARRDFLTQLGVATAILAGSGSAAPLTAQPDERRETGTSRTRSQAEKWDTSWIDKLTNVPYRVVFDANNISDGYALDLAATFFDHYHEVHDTSDSQLRAVLVMRQLGTPLALGDSIWDKYALGEELKINDRTTRQLTRRNPFLKATASGGETSLETLHQRGAILLLCNIAMNNWSRRHAETSSRPVDEVRAEVRANLVPGTILVPSGIFAIIRAQNAGCAFMRGA